MALRLRSLKARIAASLGFEPVDERASVMDSDRLRETDGEARILQVVGVPRSGTTILAVALNAHPEVVCLIEPFLAWLRSGAFPCPEAGGGDSERSEPPHRVIGELRRRPDLRWVGFKETFRSSRHPTFPTEEFVRRNVEEGAVEATVAIVRDPRDVWVSVVTRFEEARDTPLDEDFTDDWNEFVGWVLDRGVFHVRYEDLAADPQATMGRVTDHLGLEFREALLEPPGTRGAGDARAERGGSLFPSSVGRYRRELEASATAFIEERCASGMQRLGYRTGERE